MTAAYQPKHFKTPAPFLVQVGETSKRLYSQAYGEIHAFFKPDYTHRNKILEVAKLAGYVLQEKTSRQETYVREGNMIDATLTMTFENHFPTVTVENLYASTKNFHGRVGNRDNLKLVLKCIT